MAANLFAVYLQLQKNSVASEPQVYFIVPKIFVTAKPGGSFITETESWVCCSKSADLKLCCYTLLLQLEVLILHFIFAAWSCDTACFLCSLKFWYCVSFLQLEAVILHVTFAAWSCYTACHFCSLKLWFRISLLQLQNLLQICFKVSCISFSQSVTAKLFLSPQNYLPFLQLPTKDVATKCTFAAAGR